MSVMEMREQPPECPGPVYLVPGRGPEKCKGPGVGAWHVPETARRPVRPARVWEDRGERSRRPRRWGCKGLWAAVGHALFTEWKHWGVRAEEAGAGDREGTAR